MALMDNSDMELSDSDCELDVGDTDSSNGADDTGDSESEEEVARTPAPKRRVVWKKTDDFTPVIVPEPDCVDLYWNVPCWGHQLWDINCRMCVCVSVCLSVRRHIAILRQE